MPAMSPFTRPGPRAWSASSHWLAASRSESASSRLPGTGCAPQLWRRQVLAPCPDLASANDHDLPSCHQPPDQPLADESASAPVTNTVATSASLDRPDTRSTLDSQRGHHPTRNDRRRALVSREVCADAGARRAVHDDQRRAGRAVVYGGGSAGPLGGSVSRASSRSRAVCIRRCIAAGCGRCASSRVSGRRRRPTSASATCSTTARRGSRRRSTCRR